MFEENVFKSLPILFSAIMIFAIMSIANYVDEGLGNTSGFFFQIGIILFVFLDILFVVCFIVLTISDYLNSKKPVVR